MSRMFFKKSTMGRDQLELENVAIIHRNFSGAIKEFNKTGQRTFSIILTNDEAEELLEKGLSVRQRPAKEDPNEVFCFLPCTIGYNNPNMKPLIYRINGQRMTQLFESNVGTLDGADIESADVTLNLRPWSVNGSSGIKCYVQSMYVKTAEDRFASKYADYIVD